MVVLRYEMPVGSAQDVINRDLKMYIIQDTLFDSVIFPKSPNPDMQQVWNNNALAKGGLYRFIDGKHPPKLLDDIAKGRAASHISW